MAKRGSIESTKAEEGKKSESWKKRKIEARKKTNKNERLRGKKGKEGWIRGKKK
jgi:hypothetical protein